MERIKCQMHLENAIIIFTSSLTKTMCGTPNSATQNPGSPRGAVWISQYWLVILVATYSVCRFLALNQPYTVRGMWYKETCQSRGKSSAICPRADWYMRTHFSLLKNVGYLLNDMAPFATIFGTCAMHCKLCTVYSKLCTVHSVLYTLHCALCIVHSALCTVYSTLCTVHCALCTVNFVLYTVHCAHCTVYSTKCTVQCTVHLTTGWTCRREQKYLPSVSFMYFKFSKYSRSIQNKLRIAQLQ
jgi:hypothetical protein